MNTNKYLVLLSFITCSCITLDTSKSAWLMLMLNHFSSSANKSTLIALVSRFVYFKTN